MNETWIETGIAPPTLELENKAKKSGVILRHIPALEAEKIPFRLDSSKLKVVFVGSPRAAKLIYSKLKNLSIIVFCAGKTTAKILQRESIAVRDFPLPEETSEKFFQRLFKNKKPFEYLTWISAAETATDLDSLAKKLQITIEHIPVYKTNFSKILKREIQKINPPRKFIFRSGKAVQAVFPYIDFEKDSCECFGESAKRALENLESEFSKSIRTL